MSRHRRIRKMNYDDERDDEDDQDFHRYSISTDDEESGAEHAYKRSQPNSDKCKKVGFFIADFISEENFSSMSNEVVDQSDNVPVTSGFNVVEEKSKIVILKNDRPSAGNDKLSVRKQLLEPKFENDSLISCHAGLNENLTDIKRIKNLQLSQSPEKRIVENKSLNQLTRADGSSSRLVALNAARNAVVRRPKLKQLLGKEKPTVNLIVVGHVDAGKSTLMGHFLYQLGGINERIMHKYKQESAKRGKASFAYAWILDDTQEERERGVTMDVARTSFETEHRKILVLDAPGHKDFIPNMITGAAEADAGILVVNATHGEFETGFDFGGQTREHTILLRSLGVGELLVAVNKLDTVEWSQQRYDELRATLTSFLRKQASYTKVRFIPLSGLHGINLVNMPSDSHPLLQWYKGPTLLQAIDELQVPAHSCDHPFRAVINNINKISSSAISVNIKIEAGFIECKEKVYIMPDVYHVIVKEIVIETCSTKDIGFAGDNALVTLIPISSIESDSVSIGHVLCRGGEECLIPGKKYRVRVVVFDTAVPIFRGTKVELFAHCLVEPCTITHLIAELNKSTGQVIRQKPRMLTKNMSGVIEIVTERAVNLELYSVCKALGRVTFRRTGQTIAAGIIEQKVD